ncbi:hypothetical protein NPX13_g10800 [Xylaria arbuscula]|uniref:Rhodopsin domain-containing protein n=1 Tax=Xylaria arbuscula TaxID=114810 RepID=A0A9W8N4D0_9PEZI|nr:hypothetical protein NPX13_g10800 [Xylaria arbuscula]
MSSDLEPLPPSRYESKEASVITAVTLLGLSAVIAVILRFKCRFMVRAKLAIDDWLILAALPIAITEAILVGYSTKGGLGKHVEVVSAPDLLLGAKILWLTASGLVKLSILTFYLRTFGVLSYIRFSAWFLIVSVTIWLISVVVAHGLECIPVAKIWNEDIPGHCLDTVALFLGGSIADVVFDFLILVLPLPALIKLQLPLPKKISVVGIFVLGGLANASGTTTRTCILSLVRFLGAETAIWDRSDITWISWLPLIWAVAEPCLGTVCACLPILQPLAQIAKRRITKLSGTTPSKVSRPEWKIGQQDPPTYGEAT